MQAGKLTRKISLLAPDPQVNAAGEETVQYVPVGEVWAEVTPVRGTEAFSSLQRYAEVTHRFKIRYRADMTPEWVIKYQDREFDITEILEIGRREGLNILAEARAE